MYTEAWEAEVCAFYEIHAGTNSGCWGYSSAAMKIEMVTQIGVGRKSVVWSHEEDASKTKAWGVCEDMHDLFVSQKLLGRGL
ncbi:hypothetical protein Dimus_035423, partial [Dionaea muscipula]